MRKNRPCYLKAVVIVHGKSEKQICEYIKSNLRLKIEIVSEKRGEKSIQINGLTNVLNDSRFRSFDAFIRFFEDVEVVAYNKKKCLKSIGHMNILNQFMICQIWKMCWKKPR